jgi:hypothetical protein
MIGDTILQHSESNLDFSIVSGDRNFVGGMVNQICSEMLGSIVLD